jgi:phage FluMu protein Com
MGTDDSGTATPTLQREVCDKCGSRMELESSAYGFERWKCPKCQQIVGIDRDPEVGSRFQIGPPPEGPLARVCSEAGDGEVHQQ